MGVSIYAVSNLSYLCERREASEELLDAADTVSLYVNPDFPHHTGGLKRAVYRIDERYNIMSTAYGSYDEWRRELALKGAHSYAWSYWQKEWLDPRWPFEELISFSNCEGFIGTECCERLLRDFIGYAGRVGGMEYYDRWVKGLDLARNNGAVVFS